MAEQPIIRVEHVSKSFKLPHEKYTGLKQAIINFRSGRKFEEQKVLKDVSFDIAPGEFFGIVGRNGSGKSTLLKLLAQIYFPEQGGITINGSLTPFIELGVGFNPELTGRENVYLNGALLGFDRKQTAAIYDEIVDFAELHDFMDQKLKNYSSGMQVRLAFSIAIRAESDILLIDEVLAVGDAAFQQKCFNYFDKLKREKRTIILVTHDMGSVKQFCDRAVLINDGEVKVIGDPSKVALAYDRLNYDKQVTVVDEHSTVEGLEIITMDPSGKKKTNFEYGAPMRFEVTWPKGLPVGIAGFVISKGTEIIFATNTVDQQVDLSKGKVSLIVHSKIGNGRYHISAGLFGDSERNLLAAVQGTAILISNQPELGEHHEEWHGVQYVSNEWVK